MYLLLGLSSILAVLFGGYLTLGITRHVSDWSQRRTLQLSVLLMPTILLGLGICSLGASSWNTLPGIGLLLGMGVIAFGALGMGTIRLLLMAWVVTRRAVLICSELQALANGMAGQLDTIRPRVRLYVYDQPLALTYGLWKPTVLLSTWMVEHLDRRELEAVVVHELEHVARRDYLVTWLAMVLRDAFFYLPTSWVAYRQLQREKELACDDLAIAVTHRPLALASALTKVWLHAVDTPRLVELSAAQTLAEVGASINGRIERLLAISESMKSTQCSREVARHANRSPLIVLIAVQGANLFALLALMSCSSIVLIERLF
ncbi:MAG: M56 family metallopeptidase [Ktedonobacteraceae bacterium]